MSAEADEMRWRMTEVATPDMQHVYLHNAVAEAIAAMRGRESPL